jgi:holo-[acyl-carrier protein] synthase
MLVRRDRAKRLSDVAQLAARGTAAPREAALGRAAPLVAAGHDLVYLPEFAARLGESFVERAFTREEAAAAGGAEDPVPHFAARWAAKEAARKAFTDLAARLGVSPDGLGASRQYEVARRAGLATPALVLHDRARGLADELAREGTVVVSLSITDERDYAAAFVVILYAPRGAEGMLAP